MTAELATSLLGRIVVLDLADPFVVIGLLEEMDAAYYRLRDADLHDLRESGSTRDYYLYEIRQSGMKSNRSKLLIRRDAVVGLCAFDDLAL